MKDEGDGWVGTAEDVTEATTFERLTGLTVEDRAAGMSALHSLYRALNGDREADDRATVSVGMQRADGVRFTISLVPQEDGE